MNYCAGSKGISMAQIRSTLVMIVGPAGGKLRWRLLQSALNYMDTLVTRVLVSYNRYCKNWNV